MATFTRPAVLEWTGEAMQGAGSIVAGTGAFEAGASFPRIAGEPPGATTPEELLAASHAVCYGIGLRSVDGIRIRSSHLRGVVKGLEGIDAGQLQDVGAFTAEGCTISNALRGTVAISFEITAA